LFMIHLPNLADGAERRDSVLRRASSATQSIQLSDVQKASDNKLI
jgi:hypothetical protein